MRSVVRAAAETEVEIVAAHLERIRHLDILQRPAPVIVLQILGAILEPDADAGTIRVEATVTANDRTGVEMEALTAAAVAALCLYDTAKAFDRSAEIGGLHLAAKSGGKSGDYRRDN